MRGRTLARGAARVDDNLCLRPTQRLQLCFKKRRLKAQRAAPTAFIHPRVRHKCLQHAMGSQMRGTTMRALARFGKCLVKNRPRRATQWRCALATAGSSMNMLASTVATHCPYCSLQCGMHLIAEGGNLRGWQQEISGERGRPLRQRLVSRDDAQPSDRLRTPLVRDEEGCLRASLVEVALAQNSPSVSAPRSNSTERMPSPCSAAESLTNEKAYWLGKVRARRAGGRRTSTITDASACRRRLRPLLRRSASIAVCRFRWLICRTPTSSSSSRNVAETMPPVMRYFEAHSATAAS